MGSKRNKYGNYYNSHHDHFAEWYHEEKYKQNLQQTRHNTNLSYSAIIYATQCSSTLLLGVNGGMGLHQSLLAYAHDFTECPTHALTVYTRLFFPPQQK